MDETEKNPKRGHRYYDTNNRSRVKRRYHDVSVAIFYHALVVVIQRYYDCVTVNCFVMIGAKTRHHNNQVAIKKMNGLRRLDENKITTTSAIRKSSTCRGWSNFIIDTETGSSSISKMSVRQQQKQHYPKSISPLRSKNFPTKMMLRQRRWTFHNRFHSRNTYIVLFCQLLGMNCSNESEMTVQWLSSSISWDHFCQRGGQTDVHKDGWGLLYYMNDKGGGGIRQFHDVESAATSPLASFIGSQPIVTRNLLAHIRYATSGSVNIANVHPFTRE